MNEKLIINENNKYDMIIFDVDGTLCDTVDILYDSINCILEKNSINKRVNIEDIKSGQGLNRENFAKKCLYFLEKDVREKILVEADKLKYNKINNSSIKIYNKVKDTIEELSKKYLITIVSNCGRGYIETIIPKIGISNYITDYIAASAFNISKADAIKEIIRRNNAKNAIYVGDTLLDRNSSIEAGVDFIFASYGFGKNVNSKYKINDFSELIYKIKKIENEM